MAMETLHDVLVDQIKDLYGAEKLITKALPRMMKAVREEGLRTALEQHLEQTNNQIGRLEQVFKQLDMAPKAKKCAAMEGIIEEAKEVIDMKGKSNPAALDAALIAAAQKVEHYEICGYGSARTFAQVLGLDQAAKLLEQSLEEESDANERLSSIAESVNSMAASGTETTEGTESDEGEDEEEADELEEDVDTPSSSKRNKGGRR